MPENAKAVERLADAAREVGRVFGGFKGSPHWGDALPHHPHQRPGMVWAQIEALHARPARLRVDELDWAEVDYFFSHSGYTLKPAKILPPAVRYFLPRLAAATVSPDPPPEMMMTVTGGHLRVAGWQRWPRRQAAAIRRWLLAWADAALRCRHEGWQHLESMYEPRGNRDPIRVLGEVTRAGVEDGQVRVLLEALDEESAVRVIAHAAWWDDEGREDALAAILPWATRPATQERLLAAATAGRPWSKWAEILFGADPP